MLGTGAFRAMLGAGAFRAMLGTGAFRAMLGEDASRAMLDAGRRGAERDARSGRSKTGANPVRKARTGVGWANGATTATSGFRPARAPGPRVDRASRMTYSR
jgi:hypothetical protein